MLLLTCQREFPFGEDHAVKWRSVPCGNQGEGSAVQALEATTCGRALPHVYGGLLSPKVPVGAAPFTRRA